MTIHDTARALLRDRKGILIADEGMQSGSKLFPLSGVPETASTYYAYRKLLANTAGVEEYLSAVILPYDAFTNAPSDALPLHDLFSSKRIPLGIDMQSALPVFDEEKVRGLLSELKSFGVITALWRIERSVDGMPASDSFKSSVRDAVEFARVAQAVGLVPIIHADISMRGAHPAAQSEDAISDSLALISDALESSSIDLAGVIVATSMPVSGSDNPERASATEVADRTARILASALPEHISGVLFLSDTQQPEEATANFNAIARTEPLRWPLAFAFSDAFEAPVIDTWKGMEDNVPDAQSILIERLSLASFADGGGYSKGMEKL